jgi:hypothetical protein
MHFIGNGSGESLNESPLAAIWPPVSEQVERDEAILHTRPNRRPPIYVAR